MIEPGRQHPSITGADPGSTGILAKTGPAKGGAVVQRVRAAPVTINPTISPPSPIAIVVKKSHTNPKRVEITLSVKGGRVRQPATLTRIKTATSGNIRVFDAPKAGNEITFTQSPTIPTESTRSIPANELNAGKKLFAESDSPCTNLDDYRLRLTLAAGPTAGPPFEVAVVAVLLTLDISPPRTAPGAILTPLPQPPDPRPAPGTATDKWFGGLELNSQDPGNSQPRAELRASVTPGAFSGVLLLRQVAVSGDNVTGLDNKVDVFTDEIPGPRQLPPVAEAAQVLPLEFDSSTAAFPGRQFFAQGKVGSRALRDTGFQLGIKDVDNDGDRVALTIRVAPVLTFDSPIVVVKKPHTNPARRVVTVRASSAFNRTGTLTRLPGGPAIHVFLPAGQEILDLAAGHVFAAADLSAGVQLSVESTVPSGVANDVQFTLALSPAAPAPPVPVGGPATITMTAVALTLDVGLSRPSPGVAPTLMSENDKINIGRFVQVRNPGFGHERAMIILRPPNPAISLTVVLEATSTRVPPPASAQVQVFRIEEPAAGQIADPNPVTFPSLLLTPGGGLTLFVEGTGLSTAARDTGFRLGILGLENEVDRVAMTVLQVEVIDTAPSVAAATFVRFGLWDNAFRAPGSALGLLFNEEAEPDNFAGADTRRFHLRVRDVSKQNAGHVQADWITLDPANANLDAPATRDVTLVETPANSGVFISRGLLLINDTIDERQTTHSGLAAPLPDAGLRQPAGQRNHRTRKGSMLGSIRVDYKPNPLIALPLRLPIFERATEKRRRLPLQIFVLRLTPLALGGGPVIGTGPTDPFWTLDMRVIRETYERIGLKVETVVAPGTTAPDTVVANGGDSIVVIDPPAGVNPSNVTFANETTLGAAHPAIADTIRVFFVLGLKSSAGGETWHDALAPVGDARRGAAFTIQATGPYALAHEVGHALTNKETASSICDPDPGARQHFCAPSAPAGNRFQNDQNLMKRQFLGAEIVSGPKRIWDANDADTINQFAIILGSHYTRNF